MLFAVNGTLMRGLELNQNLMDANASFVCETRTAPIYRLWSIADKHPGMIRVTDDGASIAVEIWEISSEGLIQVVAEEPPGLSLGQILLEDGTFVLGILAEPYLLEGNTDITEYGGWRAYIGASLAKNASG